MFAYLSQSVCLSVCMIHAGRVCTRVECRWAVVRVNERRDRAVMTLRVAGAGSRAVTAAPRREHRRCAPEEAGDGVRLAVAAVAVGIETNRHNHRAT